MAFMNDPQAKVDPLNMNPAPGEGPPDWVLQKGGLTGHGLATRAGKPHAEQARLHMDCKGDPGYAATSKMSVEFTLGLAFEGPKGSVGGYLTPTLALGAEALMERLSKADNGN